MKLRCAMLCVLGLRLLPGAEPALTQVRHIYVLPMSGGLDQYVANKLTQSGRYQVVTDPKQAQALFTDQIGAAFEDKYTELYPPPAPPKTDEKKTATEEDRSIGSMLGEAASVRRTSTFNRGRGNVFLVDVGTRRVLWSTYLRPRTTRPDELNGIADEIVDRLSDDVQGQVKRMQRDEAAARKSAPPAPAPAPTAAPSTPAPAPSKPAAPPAPAPAN